MEEIKITIKIDAEDTPETNAASSSCTEGVPWGWITLILFIANILEIIFITEVNKLSFFKELAEFTFFGFFISFSICMCKVASSTGADKEHVKRCRFPYFGF